jgi:hypothetical protein
LAAGVLVEAGGFEGRPRDKFGEGVEEQQVGLEAADLFDDELATAAFGRAELPTGAIADGGGVSPAASADVHADDFSVDPPGAGVIASAIGASFPGHESRRRVKTGDKRRRCEGATQPGGRARKQRGPQGVT